MKKNVLFSFVLFLCLFLVTGCFGNNEENNNGNNQNNEGNGTNQTARNELFDKFDQIEVGMTRAQVNEFLTVYNEGEPGASSTFEDGNISIHFTSANDEVMSARITLSATNEMFRDSRVDLSNGRDFTARINSDNPVTYDELVAAFGTDGICVAKDRNGCTSLRWASIDGSYMTASVRRHDDSGMVTMLMGAIR